MKDGLLDDEIESIESLVSEEIKKKIQLYVSLVNRLMAVHLFREVPKPRFKWPLVPAMALFYIAGQDLDFIISAPMTFLTPRTFIDPSLW